MKKIFFVLFIFGVCISGRAQKHEFFASANIVSFFSEKNAMQIDGILDYEHADWNDIFKRKLTYGGVNIGYLNNIYTDLAIGISSSYVRTKRIGNVYFYRYRFNATYISLMPIIRKKWWQNEKWSVYSLAGIGAMFRASQSIEDVFTKEKSDYKIDKSGPVKLAYHLSLIGADFKFTKNWSVFGEAGFGCMGIVNAGIRYSL